MEGGHPASFYAGGVGGVSEPASPRPRSWDGEGQHFDAVVFWYRRVVNTRRAAGATQSDAKNYVWPRTRRERHSTSPDSCGDGRGDHLVFRQITSENTL